MANSSKFNFKNLMNALKTGNVTSKTSSSSSTSASSKASFCGQTLFDGSSTSKNVNFTELFDFSTASNSYANMSGISKYTINSKVTDNSSSLSFIKNYLGYSSNQMQSSETKYDSQNRIIYFEEANSGWTCKHVTYDNFTLEYLSNGNIKVTQKNGDTLIKESEYIYEECASDDSDCDCDKTDEDNGCDCRKPVERECDCDPEPEEETRINNENNGIIDNCGDDIYDGPGDDIYAQYYTINNFYTTNNITTNITINNYTEDSVDPEDPVEPEDPDPPVDPEPEPDPDPEEPTTVDLMSLRNVLSSIEVIKKHDGIITEKEMKYAMTNPTMVDIDGDSSKISDEEKAIFEEISTFYSDTTLLTNLFNANYDAIDETTLAKLQTLSNKIKELKG